MNQLLHDTPIYASFFGISLGLLITVAFYILMFGVYSFAEERKYTARTFLFSGLATTFYILFYIYLMHIFAPNIFESFPAWLLVLGKIAVPCIVFFNYSTYINLPIKSLENYTAWMKAKKSFPLFGAVILLAIIGLYFTNSPDVVLIVSLLLGLFENFLSINATKRSKKVDKVQRVFDIVLITMALVISGLIYYIATEGIRSLSLGHIILFEIFFASIMVMYSFVLIHDNIKNGAFNEQNSKLIAGGFFRNIYQALRYDQFFLMYQPKVKLETGRVCGLEALIRWEHPVKGLVPPNDFIPIAEETSLISNICEWVIKEAVKDITLLREKGLELPVSINFSVNDITPKMANLLIKELKENDLPPSSIVVEITETLFLDMNDKLVQSIEMLTDAHIKLSLDDFGAGHSSVRQLDKIPLSEVKIDRALIVNMIDEKQSLVVETLINMCHLLNIQVVAEGVDDEKTIQNLHAMKCEMVQGFGICRPQRLHDVIDWSLQNIEELS